MHQLERFVTESEYNKLCNIAVAIYMANEMTQMEVYQAKSIQILAGRSEKKKF